MADAAVDEAPARRPRRDETFQETMVREDERRAVLAELADAEAASVERSRAIFAMAILSTVAGAILLPLWGAILGATWWLMRAIGSAPSPW